MAYFPFFVDLTERTGLLVGGGTVALRKAEKLLPYGPALTVIAPVICPELAALPVRCCLRAFTEADLHSPGSGQAPGFVVAATDDRALNRRVAALCHAQRIPVNVVDDPAACSFLFPALVQRGRLSVGISTGGASPTAAIWLKRQIEALLPPHFATLLDHLDEMRPKVKAACPDAAARAKVLRESFERGLADAPLPIDCKAPDTKTGYVTLVGAGCGQADLVTVRGLRALRRCDAVVYDDLIDHALLQETPAGAGRYYVGKRSGCHAMSQREIEALLIRLARQGLAVARLKGGDPYVFGRGGEEALALQKAGVPFEVVPGISSAVAIPAEAGIPFTQRGVSRAVHIITAQAGGKGTPPMDYRPCAAWGGTLVFLMGVARLPQIAADLMAGGLSPATPAAVVRGGCAPTCAVRSDLAHIAEKAAGVAAPAVIVVGEVAALDLRAAAALCPGCEGDKNDGLPACD